jgi:hypothetical protein
LVPAGCDHAAIGQQRQRLNRSPLKIRPPHLLAGSASQPEHGEARRARRNGPAARDHVTSRIDGYVVEQQRIVEIAAPADVTRVARELQDDRPQ